MTLESSHPQAFGHILSSMCTVPHPDARDAAIRFLATNPGDPCTYGTVAKIETKVIEKLGGITGLKDPSGYVASGGTEANIQAVRAARNLAEASSPNIVAPESAHFSFLKAGELLGVDVRLAPLDEDHCADVNAIRTRIDEHTVLVVAVAGTTEYGRVDPIHSIAELAHGAGIRCHIDAAWGGFVLPFTEHEWNFDHAPIDSMTIDPHKMGQAAIPAGGFLVRDARMLDALVVDTPYLESGSQITLTGTRSGAGVASAMAAIEALWPDGYKSQWRRSQRNAEWISQSLVDRGYEVTEPTLPIVAASISDTEFSALRDQGWRISRTRSGELRIVCMPHVTREILETFVADLDRLRPPTQNLSE